MNLFKLTTITILLFFSSCSNKNTPSLAKYKIESVSYIKSSILSLKEIQKEQFIAIDNPRVSYENGDYWFKVRVDKPSEDLKSAVFFIEEPSIGNIYFYDNNKLLDNKKSIDGRSSFILEIEPLYNKEYYIKVNFIHQAHFPIQISDKNSFYKGQKKEGLLNGGYYGIVLMVIALNLIYYFSLKDETFLYYSLFLASINISFMGLDGSVYIFFDNDYLELICILFHFLIQVFGSLFASKFLQLKRFSSKLNLIGRLSLFLPFMFYACFLINRNFLFYALGDLLGLIVLSFYWFLGVLLVRKETYARFFVVGYSLILFMGFFYLVPLDFGINYFSVSFIFLKLGALFEMMVLTYAVTYRVKKLKEENIFFKTEIKTHVNELYQLKKVLKKQKENKININLNNKIKELKDTYTLTEREVDVVLKIAKGSSNKQIAEDLFISVSTVKYHTKNLYEKLNVKKRTEVSAKLFS